MSSDDPPRGQPDYAAHAVHIGRQPMYDADRAVVGFELLFRGASDALDAGLAGRAGSFATSQVIVNAFTDFGIEELVGDRLCFINVTRDFLVGELTLPFPPGRAVLEVLETIRIDDEIVDGVAKLVAQGYPIALDDFVWGLGHERLLSLATYVKLDFLNSSAAQLTSIAQACRALKTIRLVAEKVETEEQVDFGRKLGCTIFQGYALGRPKVLSAVTLSPARLPRVKLLVALNGPTVDIERVVTLVSNDPALTFRLLRATNAASTGLVRRVSSVREAVVLLGIVRVRQWVTLMLVADLGGGRDDQVSAAVVRARTCQTLAERIGVSGEKAFTVGLLAGVAEMLGVAPAALTGDLPLTPEIAEALVERRGRLGKVLDLVMAYEAYEATEPDEAPQADQRVAPTVLAEDYLGALGWAHRTISTLAGASSPD